MTSQRTDCLVPVALTAAAISFSLENEIPRALSTRTISNIKIERPERTRPLVYTWITSHMAARGGKQLSVMGGQWMRGRGGGGNHAGVCASVHVEKQGAKMETTGQLLGSLVASKACFLILTGVKIHSGTRQ